MTLLIIDDEPHIRQMMRLTLETDGHQVDEAATGEEGLAQFGDGSRHAAILLDQKLPGIDGLQTLARLRQRVPEACVIMVTAFASIELAVDAMKLGATDFLRKPMTPEALRGAVAAALASRPRAASTRVPQAVHLRRPIETLTLNGFRLATAPDASQSAGAAHVFQVTHFPDQSETRVVVAIDPEAVARVARLTGRELRPGGAFWRDQAQRLLAAVLWTEGAPPVSRELMVRDVSREDLEVAATWPFD